MIPDTISLELLEKAFKSKRFPLPVEEGEMILYGIRDRNKNADDHYDCIIGAVYYQNGQRKAVAFQGTTVPGVAWLKNLMNPAGTAILCEGFHEKCWGIGMHKGLPAFVQIRPVPVYRDKNRDLNYDIDPNTIQVGMFGIDIHRTFNGGISTIIGEWSAGCQVVPRSRDEDYLLALGANHRVRHGNEFSYALFRENEVFG